MRAYLLSVALLAGCDLQAGGSCDTHSPTWIIPLGAEDRLAAQSLANGSLVVAATDDITIDGTTVPAATLFRIDAAGSLTTVGATLADVPRFFSLTETGAGVTLVPNAPMFVDDLVTFSEALQIVWRGEPAKGAGASRDGHIAYVTSSVLSPVVIPPIIHVHTLDGAPIWTTEIGDNVYVYEPQVHLSTHDEVSLIDATRYEFNSSGFVTQTGIPITGPSAVQTDGTLLVIGNESFGNDKNTRVARVRADGGLSWVTNVGSTVSSAVVASNGDVLAVREPGRVVRLDMQGREIAIHDNCISDEERPGLGLLFADDTGYVLHDARGIARYEGP